MTRITITVDGKTTDLPDAAVPKLQVQVDRNNAATNTALALADWITLHLQEIAIADDLAAAFEQLRQQGEKDANAALDAAVKTTRDEMLASLNAAPSPAR